MRELATDRRARCAGDDRLREAFLARVRPAAWADQDAELEAEMAALEAAGVLEVPTEAELAGLAPDPYAGPPDGPDAWLADLPGPLLEEYLQAAADQDGPSQGEPLLTGGWRRPPGAGAGFAAGGLGDDLPPGPVLAGLAGDVVAAGLDQCSDDQLIGVLRAGRRLESWAASIQLAATDVFLRRRQDQDAAGHTGVAEHADAEVAAALTLTSRATGRLLDLALALRRLPMTGAALAAGALDVPRAMVIADEVAGLGDEHIAAVEAHVLVRGPLQTTSGLRASVHRAVIAADPTAARRRQERAQRGARVERWTEYSGTATLAGRDLPPAGVIAADAHLSEQARRLRAAGLPGTMDNLRAQTFLALVAGQPVSHLLPPGADRQNAAAPTGGGGRGRPDAPGRNAGTPDTRTPDTRTPDTRTPDTRTPDTRTSDACTTGAGDPIAGSAGAAPVGMINLTMPLSTWLGLSASPGDVSGYGPLTAEDCRELGATLARHPQTRWCVTVTGPDGHPVAHGCARPGHGPPRPPDTDARPPQPGTGRPSPDTGSSPGGAGPPPGGAGPPGGSAGSPQGGAEQPGGSAGPPEVSARPPEGGAGPPPGGAGMSHEWLRGIRLQWLATGDCAHCRESSAYRPPMLLQHLIRVRQHRCAYPGCRRPARRCDLDHTIAFHLGGRTCECNLAPLCREHHQAKQAWGWQLQQNTPGVMTWTTPSGRRYTTYPASYPG